MLGTFRKLFWVSRPVSWLNTAYPFGAAYLVSGGTIDLLFWAGFLYFLIPYNLLMYGVNDIFDYESDIANPRKGGIEGMRESRLLHPAIARAATASNLPFLVYFMFTMPLASFLILLALLFFVLAYSLKYLRLKERPGLDSVTSSIHFVGPMVVALSLTHFSIISWLFVACFFLWGVASHALGAIQDIVPDRIGGLHSIATRLGARLTLRAVSVLYLAAAVLVSLEGWPALIMGIIGLLYVMNCIPFWYASDETSPTTHEAWRRFIWLNYIAGFSLTMILIARAYWH